MIVFTAIGILTCVFSVATLIWGLLLAYRQYTAETRRYQPRAPLRTGMDLP